jgi:SSS family solute:Na+ symporter
MDQLLHRGPYAKNSQAAEETVTAKAEVPFWTRWIGCDKNFTRWDTWVAVGIFGWSLFWFLILVVGSIWNAFKPLSIAFWSAYWHITGLAIPVLITLIIAVWFTWGGVRDMVDFMRRLKNEKPNHLDDGTVVGHQNLEEAHHLDIDITLGDRAVGLASKTP